MRGGGEFGEGATLCTTHVGEEEGGSEEGWEDRGAGGCWGRG
jgi:hypothetical protein